MAERVTTHIRTSATIEVKIPNIPNFFLPVDNNNPSIDVANATDGELRMIGEIWTEELILNAQRRRKKANNE
jgi:hypothetical protein